MRLNHAYAIARATDAACPQVNGGTLRVYGWDTLVSDLDTLNDTFLSDLNLSGNTAGPYTLVSPTYGVSSNFTLDHETINWGGTPSGAGVNALLYVFWGGSNATSLVLGIHDITLTVSPTIDIDALGAVRF